MSSNPLTHSPARAPARAMLKATGLCDADLAKPLVAVVIHDLTRKVSEEGERRLQHPGAGWGSGLVQALELVPMRMTDGCVPPWQLQRTVGICPGFDHSRQQV